MLCSNRNLSIFLLLATATFLCAGNSLADSHPVKKIKSPHAKGHISPDLDMKLQYGDKRSMGRLNLFVPLAQDGVSLFFVDARLFVDNKYNKEGNLGFIYRFQLGKDIVLGAGPFIDVRRSSGDNTFAQLTLNAHFLTSTWQVQGNVYWAQNGKKLLSENAFQTDQVVPLQASKVAILGKRVVTYEQTLSGVDLHISYAHPAFENLRVGGKAYRFSGKGFKTVQGFGQSLQHSVNDIVKLEVEHNRDGVRKSHFYAGVTLTLPLGEVSKQSAPSKTTRLFTTRVVRDVDLVMSQKTEESMVELKRIHVPAAAQQTPPAPAVAAGPAAPGGGGAGGTASAPIPPAPPLPPLAGSVAQPGASTAPQKASTQKQKPPVPPKPAHLQHNRSQPGAGTAPQKASTQKQKPPVPPKPAHLQHNRSQPGAGTAPQSTQQISSSNQQKRKSEEDIERDLSLGSLRGREIRKQQPTEKKRSGRLGKRKGEQERKRRERETQPGAGTAATGETTTGATGAPVPPITPEKLEEAKRALKKIVAATGKTNAGAGLEEAETQRNTAARGNGAPSGRSILENLAKKISYRPENNSDASGPLSSGYLTSGDWDELTENRLPSQSPEAGSTPQNAEAQQKPSPERATQRSKDPLAAPQENTPAAQRNGVLSGGGNSENPPEKVLSLPENKSKESETSSDLDKKSTEKGHPSQVSGAGAAAQRDIVREEMKIRRSFFDFEPTSESCDSGDFHSLDPYSGASDSRDNARNSLSGESAEITPLVENATLSQLSGAVNVTQEQTTTQSGAVSATQAAGTASVPIPPASPFLPPLVGSLRQPGTGAAQKSPEKQPPGNKKNKYKKGKSK